jgi:hypothetical protein
MGQNSMRGFASVWRGWGQRAARKSTQLEHPDLVSFPCPNCGDGIPNFSVLIHFGPYWTTVPFRCPGCRSLLCVPSRYRWLVLSGWTVLALAVPLALGVSPWYLWLAAVVLLWILLGLLASVYVKILFPPKIVPYDGPAPVENPNDLPLNPWRKL